MKKSYWILLMLLAVLFLTAGCSEEADPYQLNDAEGFTVSVRYDANGGTFTTNTSVIVDSYDPSANGSTIALLAPEDARRGNDAFTAVNNGYFLAGWYTQRSGTEGNYTYSGKWDFETDRLQVPAGEHTASEPVLTLYAAWVPLFVVEFYNLDVEDQLQQMLYFDPTTQDGLQVPQWNQETGTLDLFRFPERSGYTYEAAYLDKECTQPITGPLLAHTGTVDYETGTATGGTMKVYVDWMEGEWYHIYNVEQFLDNASVSGSYILHSDLDFSDEIWPTSLMHGNFSGTIEGNGYALRNITVTQTNNSKVNTGLFGSLTEDAALRNVALENVTLHIKSGSRVTGASFGLLAGTLSSDAVVEDVTVTGSVLVNSGCYFASDDYSIGLLCGMGDASRLDYSGITCQSTGDQPEKLTVTADGNDVSVEFVQ